MIIAKGVFAALLLGTSVSAAAMTGADVPSEPANAISSLRADKINVTSNADLRAINIGNLLQSYKRVNVATRNGHWAASFELPAAAPEGSVVHFTRSATYATNIISPAYGIDTPARGETRTYTYIDGAWQVDKLTLNTHAQFQAIADKPDGLSKYVRTPIKLTMVLSDGNWARVFHLPATASEGAIVKLVRNSSYAFHLVSQEYGVDTPDLGETRSYIYTNGAWQADSYRISTNAELRAIENKPDGLSKYLRTPMALTLALSNGNWTRNIHLPATASEGAVVILERFSTYTTNLYLNGVVKVIDRDTSVMYQFQAGKWEPHTLEKTHAGVLEELANSPEDFKSQLEEARKVNAVIQIKP